MKGLRRFRIWLPIALVLGIILSILPWSTAFADSVDLYWVGNGGSWSQTAHWSTSDGGAGGHAVPTSTNNVYFTALSFSSGGQTLTFDVDATTKNWDMSAVDEALTISDTGAHSMQVYGSFTGPTTVISQTAYGTWNFRGTSAGLTVNIGNMNFGSIGVNFIGVGGSYTLLSNMSIGTIGSTSGGITLTSCSLDTNGYDISCWGFTTNGGGTEALVFGDSVITVVDTDNNFQLDSTTTLNAGTSLLRIEGMINSGCPLTYYDIEFINAAKTHYMMGSDTHAHNVTFDATTSTSPYINCTLHCTGDLTVNGATANRACTFTLYFSIIVDGTFTVSGYSDHIRIKVVSNTTSARTITAAAVSSTFTDYYYITGAGAGSWDLSAGDSIEFQGCSGITAHFPYDATRTMYWYKDSGTWGDEWQWSTVSGGHDAGGSFRLPPPTDTNSVVWDAASFTTTGRIVAFSSGFSGRCYNFDASAALYTPRLTSSWYSDGHLYTHGPIVTLNQNMIIGGDGGSYSYPVHIEFHYAGITVFTPSNAYADTSGSVSYYQELTVNAGGIQFGSNMINPLGGNNWRIVQTSGTIDTNGYNINLGTASTNNFDSTGAGARTITLGDTLISCNQWNITGSNYSITPGTSTITQTGSSVNFVGGALTYYNLVLNTTANQITGANTFNNLTVLGTAVYNATLTLPANQTINGTLTFTGSSTINRLFVQASVPAVQCTLTVNGTTAFTNTDLIDIIGAGTYIWDLHTTNTGDAGNNTNITFKDRVTYYWYQDTGNWSNGAMWWTGSGGTGSSGVIPLLQDLAIFDMSSIGMTSRVVTIDMDRICELRAIEVLNAPLFTRTTLSIHCYGDVVLSNGTWVATYTDFLGRKGQLLNTGATISTAGVDIIGNISVLNFGSSLTFQSNVTCTGTITLYAGLLDFYNHNVTALSFASASTTYARSLNLASGVFLLNDTAAVDKWYVVATNFTLLANTSTIWLTNTTANTQAFRGAALTTYYNIVVSGAGSYTTSFDSNLTCNMFYIDRSAASKTLVGSGAARTITTSALVIPLAGTQIVTLGGATAATGLNFTLTGGGKVVTDYLTLRYCTASPPTLTFYAGSHSTQTQVTVGLTNTGFETGDPPTGWTKGGTGTWSRSNTQKYAGTYSGKLIDTAGVWVTQVPSSPGVGAVLTMTGWIWTASSNAAYLIINNGSTNVNSVFATADSAWHQYSVTTTLVSGSPTFGVAATATGTAYYDEVYGSYGSGVGWIMSDYSLPMVSTNPISGLNKVSVTLNGNIDWMGAEPTVYCYFEYGYTMAYGNVTAVQSFSGVSTFSQLVINMTSGYTYHARAVLRYPGLAPYSYVYGNDIAFTMHAEPTGTPQVLTIGATNLSGTTATLLGTLASLGYYATVYVGFEYGTDLTYGAATSESTLTSITTYSKDLVSLVVGQTYHYRAFVRYGGVLYTYGTDKTFISTMSIMPVAVTLPAVNITDVGGTLQGSVDSMGNAVILFGSFEYGLTASYGSSTPEVTIDSAQSMQQAIIGLVTGTTYHYRFRARYTASDYVYGGDVTFVTVGVGTPGTAAPDVLAIIDAKVVSGYLEAGDQMYLVSYKCIYLGGTPVEPASEYFVVQLINNGSIVGQWPLPDWGYRAVGLYLSKGSALPYGGTYTIKIIGIASKWTPPIPEKSRVLNPSDWLGTDLTQLDEWVLQTATSIGDYYDTELLTYTASGTVLNNEGGVMFNRAISGLSTVRPRLFNAYAVRPTGSDAVDTDTGYTDTWNTSTNLGPYINGLLQDGAASLSMSQDTFNNVVGILIWVLVTGILLFAFKGSFLAGIISAPVLMAVSWGGLLTPTAIVVLAVLTVAMLAFALLPRGTG